jgi:tetratricopeptide (TPR) repeat protein
MMLCMAYTAQGQIDRAVEYGELARQKAPTPAEALWATINLAPAWSRAGRPEEAAETLAALAPVCEASQFLYLRLWNEMNLGEAYWRAGRLDEARQRLQAAADVAEQRGFPFIHGRARRLLGEVTRAGTLFKQSMAVLSEIGAENELALAWAGYGRLCHDRGDTDEAHRYLVQAMDTFERLGTVIDPELALVARMAG